MKYSIQQYGKACTILLDFFLGGASKNDEKLCSNQAIHGVVSGLQPSLKSSAFQLNSIL